MAMEFVNKPPADTRIMESSAEWSALSAPLREYGEIAGQRLAGVLSDALRQAEQHLFSASTQALTRADSEAMLEAAEFSRSRKNVLIKDFLKHFEQGYARACQYKPAVLISYRIDFDARHLEIVQHDLLDDSLEPGQLSEAIQNSSWNTLNDLTQSFGKLLNVVSLKSNEMPLNPKLIEAAVSDAMRAQSGRHEAKLRLMISLKRFLPERINRLFHDLATLMQTRDRPRERAGDALETPVFIQDLALPSEILPDCVQVSPKGYEKPRAEPELSPNVVPSILRPTTPPALPKPRQQVAASAVAPESVKTKTVMPVKDEVQVKVEVQHIGKSEAKPVVPLSELEIGVWLEYRAADGVLTELKVAWISPHKSLYLMINRKGERALSMLAKDLAAALTDGRARLVLPREINTPAKFVADSHAKKTA